MVILQILCCRSSLPCSQVQMRTPAGWALQPAAGVTRVTQGIHPRRVAVPLCRALGWDRAGWGGPAARWREGGTPGPSKKEFLFHPALSMWWPRELGLAQAMAFLQSPVCHAEPRRYSGSLFPPGNKSLNTAPDLASTVTPPPPPTPSWVFAS